MRRKVARGAALSAAACLAAAATACLTGAAAAPACFFASAFSSLTAGPLQVTAAAAALAVDSHIAEEAGNPGNGRMNKVIWTLWEEDSSLWHRWFPPFRTKELPYVVRRAHQSWRQHNPSWNFTVLSGATVGRYMDASKLKSTMTIQAKSDMIRLNLLNNHGGVWVDSTMLCMMPLDSWIWSYLTTRDYFMFGQSLCSWFIVSKPHSQLISRWVTQADLYWANRTTPSGAVGHKQDYFWMDGTLIDYMIRHPKFRERLESRPSLPCGGECSPHMVFSGSHCSEDYPQKKLSPMVSRCIKLGTLPPAVKLTYKRGCGKAAVTEASQGTNAYELIEASFSRRGNFSSYHLSYHISGQVTGASGRGGRGVDSRRAAAPAPTVSTPAAGGASAASPLESVAAAEAPPLFSRRWFGQLFEKSNKRPAQAALCAGCKKYMKRLQTLQRKGSGYFSLAFGIGYLKMA